MTNVALTLGTTTIPIYQKRFTFEFSSDKVPPFTTRKCPGERTGGPLARSKLRVRLCCQTNDAFAIALWEGWLAKLDCGGTTWRRRSGAAPRTNPHLPELVSGKLRRIETAERDARQGRTVFQRTFV